jgi:hypothetical protein
MTPYRTFRFPLLRAAFLPDGRAVFFFALLADAFFLPPVALRADEGLFRAGAAFFFTTFFAFERPPAFGDAGFSVVSGASFVTTHPLGVAASSGAFSSCWS